MKMSSNLVDLFGIEARTADSETRRRYARATAVPFSNIPGGGYIDVLVSALLVKTI